VQAVGKDCVQWLGSPPERSQKFRMLSSFNWLCIPSEYQEPKGLYVLEAALAGVPSILPNHGAFPELIADLGAGMLFNSNSADALTELLLNLRNKPEPELRRQLRDRCLSVHGLTTAGALSLQALKTIAQLH
jgi:glycosyltransferase involved in cell wall biosynthesis